MGRAEEMAAQRCQYRRGPARLNFPADAINWNTVSGLGYIAAKSTASCSVADGPGKEKEWRRRRRPHNALLSGGFLLLGDVGLPWWPSISASQTQVGWEK
jgi:hypothetical protein